MGDRYYQGPPPSSGHHQWHGGDWQGGRGRPSDAARPPPSSSSSWVDQGQRRQRRSASPPSEQRQWPPPSRTGGYREELEYDARGGGQRYRDGYGYNDDSRYPAAAYEDPRIPPPRRYTNDDGYQDPRGIQRPRNEPPVGGAFATAWRNNDNHNNERDGWEQSGSMQYNTDYGPHDSGPGYSSSRSHQHQPSEPSRDIILLGIQEGITEESLLRHLRIDHGSSVDSVTIVKDKTTGQAKGYGFALFSSLTAAKGFMRANFPTLVVPVMDGHYHQQQQQQPPPQTLRIDFAAANNKAGPAGAADGSGVAAPPLHDGIRDIGQPGNGNRVLLLRGLGARTEPEDVCSSVGDQIVRLSATSSTPLQDGKAAIERVLLLRDRHSKLPAGLAFIEVASAELATALLSYLLSREAQPYGFVVDQLPIACSFASPSSFEPLLDVNPDNDASAAAAAAAAGRAWAVRGRSDGGIGGDDSRWYRYWDDVSAGVSEYVVSDADPLHALEYLEALKVAANEAAAASKSGSAPGKGLESSATAAAHAAGALQKSKGQTIKIGFGGGANLKRKDRSDDVVMVSLPVADKPAAATPTSGVSSIFGTGEDDDEDPLPLPSKTFPGRGKGTLPNVASSKKTMNNISKWTTRQGELKADLEAARRAPPAASTGSVVSASNATAPLTKGPQTAAVAQQAISSPAATALQDEAEFDYRDLEKKACLLCQRQFKSLEVLGRHCNESELHKKNLQDQTACTAGQTRKQQQTTAAASSQAQEAASYRDRAAERRQVFHQPAIPIPQADNNSVSSKRKYADGPAPPPPPPPRVEAIHPGEDESNKGNLLLKKMGWSQGTGLGAEGEGRVAPVEAMLFQQGVGLGAAKPKETKDLGRHHHGWEGYSKLAKDGARQRYDESGSK